MMILTLEITGPQGEKLGAAARKVFRATGGTIGRLPSNDWALTDGYVSSHHAVVRYTDGAFLLEDTSTNGIFINSQDNRLVKGQPYTLKSGDWIFIEPYEIRASITSEAKDVSPSPFTDLFAAQAPAGRTTANPQGFNDPFGQPPAQVPRPPISPMASPAADPYMSAPLPDDVVDPLLLLDVAPKRPPQNVPNVADLGPRPVVRDHYRPPTPMAGSGDRGSGIGDRGSGIGDRGSGIGDREDPVAAPPPNQSSLIPDDYDPLFELLGPDDRAFAPLPPPELPRPAPPAARAAADLPRPSPPPVAARPPVQGPRHDRQDVAPPSPPPVAAPPPVQGPRHDRQDVASPPPVSGAVPSASRAGGDFAAFLAGAGLHGVEVTPELAHSFGEIFQVVVAGVMDVLQARQRLKQEFRVEVTTFRPRDNNPLKFSANVEDALHNLLVKRNAAYLGPVDAFKDAFADIRYHQIAILAGVRVAFEAMLDEFAPDRLQKEFDKLPKSVMASKEAHYWNLYRSKIHDMVSDIDSTFRTLFGDEFAQAYEEQLKLLKAQGRS